jgi:hypothetical protein
MTTDKHNKSISKFSKLSNDLNTNENEHSHNNQKIEAKTINTKKTAKFDSKTNSTKTLYKTNEINDEIYKNEIFDYNNNNQKSKLLHKKTYSSKEDLNESANYINLDGSNKSSFYKLNKELVSNKNSKEFLNLNINQENSFMLNSSYDNINILSDNKYINDKTLQSKTIEFIINEISKTKTHIKKNSLLSLPKSQSEFQISNYNSNKNASNIDFLLSDGELNKHKIINNIKRLDTRISDTSKLKNIWFNNTLKFESKKSLSTNKLTEIKTLLSKNNKMKNSIDSPCKIKRKN